MTFTRDELKLFFETGDFPTEVQFADWLDNVALWTKTTILFSDFQPSPASIETIPIFTASAGTTPQAVKVKHTVPFSGGATASAIVQIQDGNSSIILNNFNVFQAVSPTAGAARADVTVDPIPSQTAPSDYQVLLFIGGDVINNLVAGSVDIWIQEGVVT